MRQKKDWSLTQQTLDHLLSQLDSDRDKAGEKYEKIRRKLVSFFQWRGCQQAEEYADRTMDRVGRRLSEAVLLNPENPYLYFHGVGLNLLSEYWRTVVPGTDHTESLPAPEPLPEPDDRKLECINRCLVSLGNENRDLLVAYHDAEKGAHKIRSRKAMADSLNIPVNALRIRMHRIRTRLRDCVDHCMRDEMNSGAKH